MPRISKEQAKRNKQAADQRKKRLKQRRKRHADARVYLPNKEGMYEPKPVHTKAEQNRRERKLDWVNSMELKPMKRQRAVDRQGLGREGREHRRRSTECDRKAAAYDACLSEKHVYDA